MRATHYIIIFIIFNLTCSSFALGSKKKEREYKNNTVPESEQKNKLSPQKGTNWPWEDPSPNRVIASPTAFVQEKGTFNFNLLTSTLLDFFPFLNIFNVSYGITRNFEIRVNTIVPIYVDPIIYIGLGIYPKFSFQLGKYFRIGYMIDFGVVKQYFLDGCTTEEGANMCQTQLIYGGAPLIITIGSKNYYVNLSMHVINYKGYTDNCIFDPDGDVCDKYLHNQLFVIPSIGASIRISKRLKFNLELIYLFKYDITKPNDYTHMKHTILPMCGVKIVGKRFYGEINIIINIAKGNEGWGFFYPPVLPLFSFGFIYP